jgi:hypothetical protein
MRLKPKYLFFVLIKKIKAEKGYYKTVRPAAVVYPLKDN